MLPLLLLFTTLRNSNGADINKLCKENINGDTNKYDLSPLGTKVYKVEDSSGWVYHFALCGESNIDLGNDLKNDAILQTGNGEQHVVATKIISRHGGDEWVQLVFGEGDKYNNHCNKQARKAQILFICDPNVDGNGEPQLLDEANNNTDYCYYMFEWSTPLVCPTNSKSRRGMSAGKLLLLEFVVIVVVYLALGIGYKRFVLGARGVEQIPNLKFWKDMGEACGNTFKKCRGEDATIDGVRSDNMGSNVMRNGVLNIVSGDDDERLIM